MSEQNPYEQLGVTENSSFEEIQTARSRLCEQYKDDQKQLQVIEAAYDALLMERLRMRQEGKIKVPEGIRFPEKRVQPPPSTPPQPARNAPAWLQRLIDTPSSIDILLPAGVMAGLSVLVYFSYSALQMAMVLAAGSCLYFLYRKEKRLGRSVLIGLLGLLLGVIIGGLLAVPLTDVLRGVGVQGDQFAAIIAFVILWLVSSFLR
ncbi:CPP1-like family protein [Pantanalinema rosaneae CENA516]|uniref:CPP1-like family protein n=1 Tax=Pantanalinema rosaneae TaxID=1620701 RepID=UPI003D6F6984